MKIDQLIEKLQALREEAKHCNLQVCIELIEPDGIWFGDFDIDDVQVRADASLPQLKHTVEIVCKGKKTNLRLTHEHQA